MMSRKDISRKKNDRRFEILAKGRVENCTF
jgi:hypothetical protein